MIYYVYAFIVFVLDQASKWLVVKNMEIHETRQVIGEFFQLVSHRNRGAAFGILQDQRWLFLILTPIIVGGIVFYLHKLLKEPDRKLLKTALGLVLGGALGNFLDRALFGEVVDFLQFHFEFQLFGIQVDYTYPIFNLADSAIVIGVACIFLDSLLAWRNEKRGLAS